MPKIERRVVVAIAEDSSRRSAIRSMQAAGWTVQEHACSDLTDEAASAHLVVSDDQALLSLIRALPMGAGIPLVLASEDDTLHITGSDERIQFSAGPGEWAALADRWSPRPPPDATMRVTAMFGAEAITPMLARLAELMNSALQALDTTDCAAVAHQLAGVAGTLGFGDVGALWGDLSEREDVDEPLLRRETRLAIGTIGRAIKLAG